MNQRDIRSLILWTIAMVVLAAAIVWCAYLVRGALLLIYVSGLLAIGFSPLVRLLERQRLLPIGNRRVPRWFAILTLYLAIAGFVVFAGVLVVPPLVHQAQSLWASLPDMIDRAQQSLIDHGWLHDKLTLREAVEHAPSGSTATVRSVLDAAANVAGGIIGIVSIFILTLYILLDAENLRAVFLRLFPRERRPRVAAASGEITVKVSAWLGGQVLMGGVIGVTSAVGLWAIGIPFFYVLALLSGIGELIPVVGPVLSAIPALAVAATISPQKVIVVLIFFIVQQQIESHVLVPRVMSRQVGVSPVTVLVALLIGFDLLGVLGAILAIPTAAILQVVAMELLENAAA
ncbi:MAG TPA: AI-2E family transporter [Vicinamibacterales bacterium]